MIDEPLAISAVIPYGLSPRFGSPPRRQKPMSHYSEDNPFRLLYVSIVDRYKHQWRVVDAVSRLRACGIPVVLEMVGPSEEHSLRRLYSAIARADPTGQFTEYRGPVPFEDLHETFRRADAFVFASTCESFGQILLEAMASGLPIACSNRAAMPEVLGDAGIYFNPLDQIELVQTLNQLVANSDLRARLAHAAYERAKLFTWQCCADQTFNYLRRVVER